MAKTTAKAPSNPAPSAQTAPTGPKAPSRADALKELASRQLAKRRLLPFIQRINDRYSAGWVHEDICRRLERFSDEVEKGLSPRLMLLMPPRHGKSEIASKTFPAWHLGRYPDHEIIACSYNVGLAMGFSRKVKGLLEDPSYQSVFATRLHPDFQAVEEWGIANHRGGYVAAGVGGGITGKGAHVLIIDDPIKNAEEADSGDIREKLWDWYGSTAYTRLAPGGGVLVIQTWWHDDDLAGRLQTAMKEDPESDQFEIIKYPAIAEHDEYLDEETDQIVQTAPEKGRLLRLKGEALHPARYDVTKLKRIKSVIPNRFWSALYQQNPVPDDGIYFTKEQFVQHGEMPLQGALSKFVHVYQTWDFAIGEKQQNDFTVGSCGIQDADDTLHVPEVVRMKTGDAFSIVEAILNLAQRWYHPSLILGFEDGQIFRSIEKVLQKRMRERNLIVPYEVLKPLTDKMARARPLQGRMQQRMVSFDTKAEWYPTIKNEMLRFPAGVHDDCVDSLAWLAHLVVGKPAPQRPKPKSKLKSWKDRLNGIASGNVEHHMAA